MDYLSKELTNLTVHCGNFILLGDFNFTIENQNFDSFMDIFHLESLIKTPTCFKINNPFCMDLFVSNEKDLFKKSCIVKCKFIKSSTKAKFYREYKKFENEKSRTDLYSNIEKKEVYFNYILYCNPAPLISSHKQKDSQM